MRDDNIYKLYTIDLLLNSHKIACFLLIKCHSQNWQLQWNFYLRDLMTDVTLPSLLIRLASTGFFTHTFFYYYYNGKNNKKIYIRKKKINRF